MLRHVPNAITASRGLAGPLVLWLVIQDAPATAFLLFTVAGLTDLIDGRLAARWGSNRALGAVLDPIADKVLLSSAWIGLGLAGRAAPWMAGTFVLRDLLVGVVWLTIARHGTRVSASRWGQLATSYEGTALGILMFPGPWLGVAWPTVGTAVGLAAMGAALISGAGYLRDRRVRPPGQDRPTDPRTP